MTTERNPKSIVEQALLIMLAFAISLWFVTIAYAVGHFADTHVALTETILYPVFAAGFEQTYTWHHVARLLFGVVVTGLLFETMYALRVNRGELL